MNIKIVNKGFEDSVIVNKNHFDVTTNKFWDSEISEMSYDAISWLFDNNSENIEYTFHTLEDVKLQPNEKFYFIYNSSRLNFSLLDGGNLPYEFIDLFKQKNLKIIFLDPHESVLYYKLQNLSNFISSNKIDKERFLYINNDYSIEKKSNDLNFIGKKWNHLFINTSGGYIDDSKNIIFKKDREFVFLSKNKMIKPHRLIFLSFLQKNNLLNITNYSCLHQMDYDNKTIRDEIKEIFGNTILNYFLKNIHSIRDWDFIQTKYEKGKYTIKEEEHINYAGVHDFRDYDSSYINLTTESGFKEDFLHISEKSLKPFAMYQLPIIVSCPFHVKAMKELYDLDMFDDFIDHSYDKETNNVKRMNMIFNEILRLTELQNTLPKFFEDNKQRFIDNRNKIEKIGRWQEKKLFNYILNY